MALTESRWIVTLDRAEAADMLEVARGCPAYEWEVVEQIEDVVRYFAGEPAAVSVNLDADAIGRFVASRIMELKDEGLEYAYAQGPAGPYAY